MAKDNYANYYYYSYHSPAVAPPSAPPADDAAASSSSSSALPPTYEEAIGLSQSQDPTKANERLAVEIPAYNPSSSSTIPDCNVPLLANEQQEEDNPFRGRPAPPGYSVYRAAYETKKDGTVWSRDEHLNSDGEALVQFLKEHNTPPKMHVRFYGMLKRECSYTVQAIDPIRKGYHEETHWRTRTTRDRDGNTVEETEPVTQRVDDFEFFVDASDAISPQCRAMHVVDRDGSKTVRQLCDDYVHETNRLKELQMTKVIVDWDFGELTRAFTSAIRTYAGYHHSIEISFELKEHKVLVKSNSRWARTVDHWAVRWFCYLTLLVAIAWPILWLYRKRFGHATLKSEWSMAVSERAFYQQHIASVLTQVREQHQRNATFGAVPFIL